MEISDSQCRNLTEQINSVSKTIAEITCSLEDVRHNLLIVENNLTDMLVVMGNVRFPVWEGPS